MFVSALALSYLVCLFTSFIHCCVVVFLYFSAVIFLSSFIPCNIYFTLWMKAVSRAGALANSFMRFPLSVVLRFTLCNPFRIPMATLPSQNCVLCFSIYNCLCTGHGVYLHSFLTSAPDKREWSALPPGIKPVLHSEAAWPSEKGRTFWWRENLLVLAGNQSQNGQVVYRIYTTDDTHIFRAPSLL